MYYNFDGENRNKIMRVGILQGKKARYNSLILSALLFWPKTTNEIAMFIADKTSENKKSIYSVIARPKGRLEELLNKQYVERVDKKWKLMSKGFMMALLINKNSLDNFLELYNTKDFWLNDIFKGYREMIRLLFSPMGEIISIKKLERVFYEYVHSKEFFVNRINQTKNLIDSGVDLDSLSDFDFAKITSNLTETETLNIIKKVLKKD